MYLIFDTETTGLPKNYNAPISDLDNWPRCIQIAWQLHDAEGKLISAVNHIIRPDGFDIPFNSVQIHGITTERALAEGKDLKEVLAEFNEALAQTTYVAGHNIEFDINIMGAELLRMEVESQLMELQSIDTKNEGTDYCAIPGGKGGKFKWPTLSELHNKLFGVPFSDAHNAAADVEATARCFFELCRLEVIQREDIRITQATMDHLAEVAKQILSTVQEKEIVPKPAEPDLRIPDLSKAKPASGGKRKFVHLHTHSQYSVLQSTSSVQDLVQRAAELNMPGIALTDHSNMYGAFHIWQAVDKANAAIEEHNASVTEESEKKEPIKVIFGAELNIVENHEDRSRQDNGYQQVFLAKNEVGYHNLAKLSSMGFTEGFYYVARVSKSKLLELKEGLIATTGWIYGEIPSLILNVGEKQAEEAFVWYKEQFGDDFYAELNRHGLPEEEHVNRVLLGFCEKYGVKYIAANNNYYIKKEQAKAHEILLCIKDNEKITTPIGKGRGFRYGLPNNEFYYKSAEEMSQLFHDLPEALDETVRIAESIDTFKLARNVLLPRYDIPNEFEDQDAYLRHLTFEGAKKRYGEITPEIEERLDFELKTIANTGYPGYFLIVQDFTNKAREIGVSVGPGRGSAAGSAVAYCIGITNVDPIKYDLLFERFLNPERVSMPDIDIDFDDRGREDVIKYVIDKYGQKQVAQIITYGTLGGKSALRDAARVLDYPLAEADILAKSFPNHLSANLKKLLKPDGIDKKLLDALNPQEKERAYKFREMSEKNDKQAEVIRVAYELEGSVRNTGIHACGVIITPDDITNFVPVSTTKDANMWCTQFDNSVAESAGLLKMDFLGLKTLTIIKDAVSEVHRRKGLKLDPDELPLDDEETYALFQRGETNGIFQFESLGMQKNLKELKPDKFEDLIAMNALYRPGPMEYIPNYIARKHGQEPISYDLPDMEEYLSETYGITVYQEQVMRLSQKLAGFSKGQADTLRKAMGKKQKAVLDKMKATFVEGAMAKGHPEDKLNKIWTDWEAFAQYAFNKSHSTCYAFLAFQTAYFKAHHPHEFMASVLNHEKSIEDITFYMSECRRMNIEVLGPSVNESELVFSVDKNDAIRFGLGAIKGVGEGAAREIMEEREKNGPFTSIFDLTKRVNLKSVNKRVMEALAVSGAFDCFDSIHRAQYFFKAPGDEMNIIEKSIRYGANYQRDQDASQVSLFGGGEAAALPEPQIPECEPWQLEEKLNREKEVVGMYLSGHPLDKFSVEINELCTHQLRDLNNIDDFYGKNMLFGGMKVSLEERETYNGSLMGFLTMEDYTGQQKLRLNPKQYPGFRANLQMDQYFYVKATVQRRAWPKDSTENELVVLAIGTLREMKAQMLENLVLMLPVAKIANGLSTELQDQLSRNKGETQLKMRIVDPERKINLPMRSNSIRLQVDQDLLQFLKKNKISYSLEMAKG
ncbi:MAG: DNA polymerase III subunit alpha [Bacteroidetes bacterium]|nr:MAG: DNA polymerase III subunit alpha [Bacteroidota bacterium]